MRVPMPPLVDALLAPTIWARELFGNPPDRYSNIYRVVLPVFDVALLYSGIWAIVYGAPAFAGSDARATWSLVWGIALTLSALICLIGISIPKLFVLEAIGKSTVLGCLSTYLLALVVLTHSGSQARGIVTGLVVAGVLLASWRLGDIRLERRLRRRQAEAAAAAALAEQAPA